MDRTQRPPEQDSWPARKCRETDTWLGEDTKAKAMQKRSLACQVNAPRTQSPPDSRPST